MEFVWECISPSWLRFLFYLIARNAEQAMNFLGLAGRKIAVIVPEGMTRAVCCIFLPVSWKLVQGGQRKATVSSLLARGHWYSAFAATRRGSLRLIQSLRPLGYCILGVTARI